MEPPSALVKAVAFSIFICCIRSEILPTVRDDEPSKRLQGKGFTPVGGSRFLLAFSPGDDETNSQETQPQFDYTYQIKREHNGRMIICQRTTCPPGSEVKPCEENYDDDTCVDCPPGKQMLDSTRSEALVLHCVDIPSCHDWPGTIETAENHQCAGGFRMRCRCNTEDGKCGYDPCHCSTHWCADGEKLQQNCECKPLEVTEKPYEFKPEVTVKRPTQKIQPPAVEELIPIERETEVIVPRPPPNEKQVEGDYWPGADDWKTISTSVTFMALILLLVFCCVRWIYIKRKGNKLFDCLQELVCRKT